jgi:hypothetical protein
MPAGRATSPLARKVSRRWYTFAGSDPWLRSVAFDFTSRTPAIIMPSVMGVVSGGLLGTARNEPTGVSQPLSGSKPVVVIDETRTPFGIGTWVRSAKGFANRIERLLAVPAQPAVALSGAWTTDSVFTLKIVAPETPYYSTLTFAFHGDSLTLDSEYNVAFVPTKLPRLEGRAAR